MSLLHTPHSWSAPFVLALLPVANAAVSNDWLARVEGPPFVRLFTCSIKELRVTEQPRPHSTPCPVRFPNLLPALETKPTAGSWCATFVEPKSMFFLRSCSVLANRRLVPRNVPTTGHPAVLDFRRTIQQIVAIARDAIGKRRPAIYFGLFFCICVLGQIRNRQASRFDGSVRFVSVLLRHMSSF